MDLKLIIGAGVAAAGVVGAAIAAAVSGNKKEDESSNTPEQTGVGTAGTDETTQTTQASDASTTSQIDEEIEAAWREKELLDAENSYYREQQIADEIQQAWIERDMLEAGYSTEEVETMREEYWDPQEDLYNNDGGFAADGDIMDEALYDDIADSDNDSDETDVDDLIDENIVDDIVDDETEIDNTDLSYSNRFVFIRLNNNENERRNHLKASISKLCLKYPRIRELQSDDKLQTILDNEFRDGFPKNVFIRNLTFQMGERTIPVIAIRPVIAPGDFLLELLPEGVTLMFRGHILRQEFVVDDIYDAVDTSQLPFEAFASIIPRSNPNEIGRNLFKDILEDAESLAKYTAERLNEWKEYLRWYKQICIRQVYGIKYYRFQYDIEKKQVIFWLVCKDEAYFKSNRRYLSRDIQIFDNDYSTNEWVFEFAAADDGKRRYARSIELGRFRGVKESYYLVSDDDSTTHNPESHQISYVDDEDEDVSEPTRQSSNTILSDEDVVEAFDNPYIVKVAYDLPRDIKDRLQDQEFLSEDEERYFIHENYLADISPNGFLALSAVGDLALIKRFERAIFSLERDECYSPNLAAWLFNIDQARLPFENESVEIEHWLNPNIAENENQKEAVRKMIAAPDICLIQGPPGTGKTTVIAEAIFQLVIQGNRVLIASQSNDAVDNALERLADRPEIRAIRLGQRSRRKRNVDLNKRKFSEDEALKYYYQALSLSIREKWLDQWDLLERQRIECHRDIKDLQNYQQDIAEYQTILNVLIQKHQELQRTISAKREHLTQLNHQNAAVLDAKQKAQSFENILSGVSESKLFLSDEQLDIVSKTLNPIIRSALNVEIQLTLRELNVETQGTENSCELLRILLSRLHILDGICTKIRKCGHQSVQNVSGLEILENRRNEIKSQMADAAEADDDELLAKLRKELNRVKDQIEAARGNSTIITLDSTEKQVLSASLVAQINTGDVTAILEKVESIVLQAKTALNLALSQVIEYTDKLSSADTSSVEEQIKTIDSQLKANNDKIQEAKSVLGQKQSLLQTLSVKYNTTANDFTAIMSAISQTLQSVEKKLSDSEMIRRQWEDVMTHFNNRLTDNAMFSYDQKYYQPIYVNSCNVVGISCTDNMRSLTDNGYEDFDVVIIDEVSKATPPELLIPLMKARRAILVGDHRQLPPMFKEHERSYNDLVADRDSIPEELRDLMTTANFRRFRDMVTSSLFREYFERADDRIRHPLLIQYRMHSDIMAVINRFYENRLENGWSADQEAERKAHGLTIRGVDGSEFIVPTKHAYWLDSSHLPNGTPIYDSKSNPKTKEDGGTSVYNTLEQYIIIELIKKMADSWRETFKNTGKKKEVGIISFYQAQVNRIRELFRDAKRSGFDFSPLDVDINTVDRFQGKEKHVIITSLVTNSPKGRASKHVITFERINVAFSRAQQLLVIVGAQHTYEKLKIELPNMDNAGTSTVSVYQNIMEEMHRKGCFKGSEKLITPDIEERIMKEYKGGEDE